ncbi:hypothetical protein C7S18_02635 [Ahniella affigens]|uniref:Phosphatidic acid phosphatase type 2/haloperoxidase domain-containing protein n=1 Tax=Ahniella affigens TaxID=2021234 RepID=A0A2P1PMT5_9GAMM|nr:vanadium-dependent haloperoxidase [Ahniella affigens]AVP96156.1 hypothetical protein C7S18_02635 [Ahniella affigens]
MNRFRIVLSTLMLLFAMGATAQEHLDLEPIMTAADPPSPEPVPRAESVFHDHTEADADAAVLIESWQTEPASLGWTRIQIARHIKHKAMPTRAARGLALVHVAMHDAYVRAPNLPLTRRFALSQAAADVLSYLYPAEEDAFQRIVDQLIDRLGGDTPPADISLAQRIGRNAAQTVIARAERDGAQRGWNGSRLQWYGDARQYQPGTWEPTGPYFYYPPDEPFAPKWKPWILTSPGQFRPPPPPAFGSDDYLRATEEVLAVNAALTPKQLEIAKYWVDGHGSATPSGHWNRLAMEEVKAAKLDEPTTIRLFAELNIALADAFIACWDSKYYYWTIRPTTAAKRLLGKPFTPPILTPPFPSYTSGHATFSGAASRVLARYLPNRAKALDAMAEEAAQSRLLGGIHFRFDNDQGLILGRNIAAWIGEQGLHPVPIDEQ